MFLDALAEGVVFHNTPLRHIYAQLLGALNALDFTVSGHPKRVEIVQLLLSEAAGQAAATFAVVASGQLALARVVLSIAQLQAG